MTSIASDFQENGIVFEESGWDLATTTDEEVNALAFKIFTSFCKDYTTQ